MPATRQLAGLTPRLPFCTAFNRPVQAQADANPQPRPPVACVRHAAFQTDTHRIDREVDVSTHHVPAVDPVQLKVHQVAVLAIGRQGSQLDFGPVLPV